MVLGENKLNRDGACCKIPDLVGWSGGPGREWLEAGIGKTWLKVPLQSRKTERKLERNNKIDRRRMDLQLWKVQDLTKS